MQILMLQQFSAAKFRASKWITASHFEGYPNRRNKLKMSKRSRQIKKHQLFKKKKIFLAFPFIPVILRIPVMIMANL